MERLLGLDAQLIHDAIFLGINIFILFFAMSYMFFNPVRDWLQKRQDKIKGELDFAANEKEAAMKMKETYEAKLAAANKEAEELLETARKKAQHRDAQMLQEAKEEAARVMQRANAETELEKKKALEEVKQEMISIAALMAEKAVSASMDAHISESLIEETLKEIGDSTWQS